MTYPFLQVELPDLVRTLENDLATTFYLRVVEALSIVRVRIQKGSIIECSSEVPPVFLEAIKALEIPDDTILVVGHTAPTDEIKKVLREGLEGDDEKFPVYSTILSALVTYDNIKFPTYELTLLDVLKNGGRATLHLPIKARAEILQTYLQGVQYVFFPSASGGAVIRVPAIIEARQMEVPMKIEMLMTESSLYHSIQIFGRMRYGIRNPHLIDMPVNLYPELTNNFRELAL